MLKRIKQKLTETKNNWLNEKLTKNTKICGIDADILRETIAMTISLGIFATILTYISVKM